MTTGTVCGVARPPVVTRLLPQECLSLLGHARIGHLALTLDALPVVRTVRFALADDAIVVRVRPGSRLHRAAVGRVVAFHVDDYDEGARGGWSVMVQGVCEPVADPAAIAAMQRLPLDPWADPPEADCFLRVATARISGEQVHWPEA